MKVDFIRDMKAEMHEALSESGIRIPIRSDFNTMLLDYLTIHKKIIKPIPRKVQVNPDFEKAISGHQKKVEIEKIQNRLQEGLDVNMFQNKRLFQSKFHDHLLYEWNIYHFHLSLNQIKKKFVKQVNHLLFAFIKDDIAILLGTETHKKGIFADTIWIEILAKHFPEQLDEYHAKDTLDFTPHVNSVERQLLWDKGYTLGMTKVGDKIYVSPGIGRTTSGHSSLVVMQSHNIIRWVGYLTKCFETHWDKACDALGIPSDCDLKLIIGDVTLEIIERKSLKTILVFPNEIPGLAIV